MKRFLLRFLCTMGIVLTAEVVGSHNQVYPAPLSLTDDSPVVASVSPHQEPTVVAAANAVPLSQIAAAVVESKEALRPIAPPPIPPYPRVEDQDYSHLYVDSESARLAPIIASLEVRDDKKVAYQFMETLERVSSDGRS